MQYEQPQYSDGIVKNRQQRFGGLNHNPGAGDGQLYEMHNLGSDYFPLLSTRMKRRKYRQLAKCNGLFAAKKLCWVDGTEFFYDGVKKGNVADTRKSFAAINDMILIFPDNKYYDIVEDKFGRLTAVFDAASLPGRTETVCENHEDAELELEAGEQWGCIYQPGSIGSESTQIRKPFRFTHNSIRNYAEEDKDWTYNIAFEVGAMVTIMTSSTVTAPPAITKGERVFSIRGVDHSNGTLTFDDNSFDVPNGETVTLYVTLATEARMYPAEYLADEGDSEGRASLLWYKNIHAYLLHARQDGEIAVGDTIRIKGGTIEENNVTCVCREIREINNGYYIKTDPDTFTAGVSDASDTRYRTSIEVNGGTAITWEDMAGGSNTERKATLRNAGWAKKGFAAGKYLRISGSDYSRQNGYFLIREVTATGLRYVVPDDGTTETVAEDKAGVKFEQLDGPPMSFTAVEVDGQDEGVNTISQEGREWSAYFAVGEVLQITGCSITENNGYFRILEIDDSSYSMRFKANSFTAGNDAAYNTVMRTQRPGILEFADGTLYGVAALSNTIRVTGVDWSEYFKVGDVVEISGSSEEHNNQSIIVREIEGDELRFYENSFVNCFDADGVVVVRRPGAKELTAAFECENRIWGFKGQTIYASKLGDPFNFSAYDGLETDSWTIDLGGFETVTGGMNYQGYPTFMTDGALLKVYGSVPSNYELIQTATTGCAPGSERSLAIAAETLFWMNRNGVCAYAGGVPTMINAAFGNERYRDAVAGSNGEKYYISAEDQDGVWHLFVYDVRRGMWHEEDNTQVIGFAYYDGNLYYADSEGNVMLTGNLKFHPEDSEEEESFDWWAEFTDFVDDSPNKKGINKFQIRMELDEDEADPPSVTVKLMCDSDGTWIIPEGGTIENPEKRSYILPIIPRRADHYKLRIEGHGGCRIYSIAKEYYQGSDFKSQPGRH